MNFCLLIICCCLSIAQCLLMVAATNIVYEFTNEECTAYISAKENITINHLHSDLQSAKVKSLTINGTNVSTLPSTVFTFFPNLQNIFASNLNITNLSSAFAIGLFEHLMKLKLSLNSLQTLDAGSFAALPTLHDLMLDNNELSQLDKRSFDGLHSLQNLDLRYNQITALPLELFQNLTALLVLQLDGNKLEHLDTNSFVNNIQLRLLMLRQNRLKTVELASQRSSITRLYLEGNCLTTFPLEHFAGLEELDLSDNPDYDLKNNTFSGNTKIFSLKLYNVTLGKNEDWYQLFRPLTAVLQYLFIGKNGLHHVSFDRFPRMEALEYLDFEYNDLEKIELGSFRDRFPKVKSLKTIGNKMKGHSLQELIRELGRLKVNLIDDKIEPNTPKPEKDSPGEDLPYGMLELIMLSLILLVILSLVILCACFKPGCKAHKKLDKPCRDSSDLYENPDKCVRIAVPESIRQNTLSIINEPFYEVVGESRFTNEPVIKHELMQQSYVRKNNLHCRDSKVYIRRHQPTREPIYDSVYELDYHRPRSSVYQCIL